LYQAQLCAAQILGIPMEKITVAPTETSKVPNNTATGGSGTSECTAQAVMMACDKLKERLQPYMSKGLHWEGAISQANLDGVSLMSTAWFKPGATANTNTYATYGVAMSEVLVDALTGEVRVERVDIHMDLGTQLDAAVDVGQLQGGFVMALGYCLSEEMLVAENGRQLNLGTWDYKIPGAYDIPVEFNVSLLKDSPNPAGIRGSKCSAEPVLGLVSSTYLAIKAAIYAARAANGLGNQWFQLDLPLTVERVQAAAGTCHSSFEFPTA
jgi:xanthine dehydrogenase/oxidase